MLAQLDCPIVSVIVPVRNSPGYLRSCLGRLQSTTYKDYEIIVVDDASTDDTPNVAEQMGVHLLRRLDRGGPSAARNDGARVARGKYLFFLDADVCVHPETVGRLVEAFERETNADAVFGSYDANPAALNILSQYKNLFHHFVHQDGNEHASTFWAGCGAVKRDVFLEMNGFNLEYGRPCIEDIELGVRLHKAGRRIVLDKRIQATHLKKWTLWSILRTDVFDRGVPWTQLILQQKSLPNDLNLKLSQRLSAVLAYGLLACLIVGAWFFHGLTLLPILAVMGLLMVDYWSESRRVPTTVRAIAVLVLVAVVAAISFRFRMWTLVGLACLLGIILFNYRFYVFFARQRHPLFAALVVPLHIMYFLYSGAAFGLGVGLHVWQSRIRGRRKQGTVELPAETLP